MEMWERESNCSRVGTFGTESMWKYFLGTTAYFL